MAPSERRLEYLPLDDLIPAERNPKRHNIDGIKAALSSFGVADVIGLIDERTGRLIGGHGRTEALSDLRADGAPAPDGVRVDKSGRWSVPVFRGWASKNDSEADAVIIALNQHTMATGFDHQLYDTMLRDLYAAGMDSMAVMAAAEWPAAFGEIPNFEPTNDPVPRLDNVSPNRCPSCGFAWHVGPDGSIIEVDVKI
jgi:hypothetical protein